MINQGDSIATVKTQISDALALAGVAAPTSWEDSTDKLNAVALTYGLPGLTDGMAGAVARERINAIAEGYDPVIALGDDLYEDWWAGAGITLNVDKVSAWAGRKNGWTVSQVTAGLQPGWVADGLNGKPCVVPDGIDDYLTVSPAPAGLPVGSTPIEVWELVDQTIPVSDVAMYTNWSYGLSIATTRRGVRRVQGGVSRASLQVGNGVAASYASNTTIAFEGLCVVRYIVGSTESRVRVNGEIDPPPLSITPATTGENFRFFSASAGAPSQFGGGKVNRRLFTKPLSDDKAAALLNFLMVEGGVS